jgi:hypothetical protein
MTFLLANWRLVGLGALVAFMGVLWLRAEMHQAKAERAVAAMEERTEALKRSEQQNAALAGRLEEEVRAHHQAQLRERRINDQRRAEQIAARTEHERITREIIDSLGSEACSAVPVPVLAVDGLRDYAAYANGLRGSPRDTFRGDSLQLE